MTRYFDASALVKRYVRENVTTTVRRLLTSGIAATSRLSEVEVCSGIIRRAREGAFTTRQRERSLFRWSHSMTDLSRRLAQKD